MIGRDKVLVVDVDGTLCDIKAKNDNYIDVAPEPQIVDRLRQMHADGWRIILNSSRGMNSNDGNIGLINRNVMPVMLEWLRRHEIPFDEIHLGKPWPGSNGFYVDDRALRPREFIENDLIGAEALISRDRIAKG